jgi:lysophospholipid acyltransferase (LPLAT)-like uncharacterized protein
VKIKVPPPVAAALGAPLASAIASTWRYEVVGQERWDALSEGARGYACMLWHEALLPLLWWHRRQGVVIVVSEARDGQYLADFAERIGFRLVRGSSTRGGTRALLAAVRELEAGEVLAVTPDGPRGPRRQIKPGVLAAAQRSGTVVLPVHAEAQSAWRLNSWDRFSVPRPFSRIRVVYGSAFGVEAGEAGLAAAQRQAAAGMDEVTRMAQWPSGAATRIG